MVNRWSKTTTAPGYSLKEILGNGSRKRNPGTATQSNLSWGRRAECPRRPREMESASRESHSEGENSTALARLPQEFSRVPTSTCLWENISKLSHTFPWASDMATDLSEARVLQSSHWILRRYNSGGHYSLRVPNQLGWSTVGTVLHILTSPLPNLTSTFFLSWVLVPNKDLACQTSSEHMLPENPTCDRRRGFQGDS